MIRQLTLAVALCVAAPVSAQQADPAVLAAQKTALDKLAMLDGEWRGTASVFTPSGQKFSITHTERVGPMLNGTIRVVEGRSHLPNGGSPFNAFAVISYDVAGKRYTMRSYVQGHQGDFTLTLTDHGFSWSMTGADGVPVRYTAVVGNGRWVETGERIVDGKPVKYMELDVTRIGDSSWPAAGAVPAK